MQYIANPMYFVPALVAAVVDEWCMSGAFLILCAEAGVWLTGGDSTASGVWASTGRLEGPATLLPDDLPPISGCTATGGDGIEIAGTVI